MVTHAVAAVAAPMLPPLLAGLLGILVPIAEIAIITSPFWGVPMVLCVAGVIKTKHCGNQKKENPGAKVGLALTGAQERGERLRSLALEELHKHPLGSKAQEEENHTFPQNFSEKLADWAVQRKNFTGETPLVVAVEHPANAPSSDERAVTLFNVYDGEKGVPRFQNSMMTAPDDTAPLAQEIASRMVRDLLAEAATLEDGGADGNGDAEAGGYSEYDDEITAEDLDLQPLLDLAREYLLSTNFSATRDAEDLRNATLVAQKLGGVAANFEEIVEA
ncbi:MAG: hypothetical protein M1831_000895 [Alyxoria varia]|nr:MAG: hypothetical protein M1831_000895 [Alyxoria varia]